MVSYKSESKAGTDINGIPKINQDSYFFYDDFNNIKNLWLFGVFDGHGLNGHLVSKFIKGKIPGICLYKI